MAQQAERIEESGQLLAIVVRKGFGEGGCNFVSPENFSLQLGVHVRDSKMNVRAHKHIPFDKVENLAAQEFFYVESGRVRVGLYVMDKQVRALELGAGDMVVLNCAHDVQFLEKTKMIEVKQGPYRGKSVEKEYF